MADKSRPHPDVRLAEGFVMPDFDQVDVDTINEVFRLDHYTSAPLILSDVRSRIFGVAKPEGPQASYACNGFVIHTGTIAEGGVAVDTLSAPMPGQTDIEFMRLLLSLTPMALPNRRGFPLPLRRMASVINNMGLRAIAGIHISVHAARPEISFGSLVIPKVYANEIQGPNDPEPPQEFAIMLAALAFARLTTMRIKDMESQEEGSDDSDGMQPK